LQKSSRARHLGRRLIAVALLPLALSIVACAEGTTGASDVSFIEWKSSFGFCPPTAYCTTRLRVSGRQAVLTLESRESPAVLTETQLTAAEADALAEAAARARFDGLPPVVGCPDCADGGAEMLTVMVANEQRDVTFEYNARLDALEPLLGQMRSLVERLRLVR
jgi:hypothetical protein